MRSNVWWALAALCRLSVVLSVPLAFGQTCGNVQLQLTADYSFAIGSSSGGSACTFALNGKTLAQGPLTQLGLFHYDSSLNSTSGIAPASASSALYDTGKFGKGVYLQSGGVTYPATNLFNVSEGTVEMWVSPRYNGSDPASATATYTIFQYSAANGDYLTIGKNGHVIFVNGSTNGQYQSAYGGNPGDGSWKAGEWHHLAATFSASANHIRFYMDGVKIAHNNEGHYTPRSASGGSIQLGSAAFTIDEMRIASVARSDAEIALDASRSTPFADNEVTLSLGGVAPGQLNYSVSGCGSATYNFTGVPISNLSPASGLLRTGSTSVAITFNTTQPTLCRYSVGNAADYASMRALDSGPTALTHAGFVSGLSSDPQVFNQVYIRCASNPDYLHAASYRVVAPPGQAFPRIGNIWVGNYVYDNAPDLAKKIQLFLGPNGLSATKAAQLRAANPGVLVIPAVNVAVTDGPDAGSPPDAYYLKDIHGNRIIGWCSPQLYVLNTAKPEVALFLGRYAYQLLAQSNFAFDGLFFDSFNTTIQQPFTDCNGNTVQIDSNGDGVPDDPAVLNAAWKAGVYSVLSTFRSLAPGAYISGHVLDSPAQPDSLAAFNGTSLEGFAERIRDGQATFSDWWELYQTWGLQGVSPAMTMIQACPPNQLSYGYGYNPLSGMLPATADFARSSYTNMRFGLGFALMGDGFFGFDLGDEPVPVTWRYDEYDFDLGYPVSPPSQIAAASRANLLVNGGFETVLSQWQLFVANDGRGKATATSDTSIVAEGTASAHINVATAATTALNIRLTQSNIAFSAGKAYRVQFWARADSPRTISIYSPAVIGQTNPGAVRVSISTAWALYSASFTAATTAKNDLEFWVGDVAGNVWIDDVQLSEQLPQVYRRDFTNGVVLLNGSATPQTITLEPGLKRFTGTQAPLYQYMVDDSDSGFSFTGSWNTVTYNTGSWGPAWKNLPSMPQDRNGPYYHCWQGSCHQLDSGSGQAQWNLNIPADGQYTIQVWLPAAPGAANWTKNAVYEVVAGVSTGGTAEIQNGTTAFATRINLSQLEPGSYSMVIRQVPLDWNLYPVVIR